MILILGYFFSFFIIWYGAGLIITAVNEIAHKINLSSFTLSFFILGVLTSIPEFSVGVSSILDKEPEVFVGTLIGGIIVIFLLIIPILAVAGNGIKLSHELSTNNLAFALLVAIAPSFLIADKKITAYEAIFLILLYVVLICFIEKKKGLLERVKENIIDGKSNFFQEIFKVFIGIIFVFVSSKYIVMQTKYFSEILHISSFVVGLLLFAFGTNLPELSLAVRSIANKKKEVAFGDYLGSAASNTLLVGVLTLINGGQVIVVNHFLKPFIFTVSGMILFFLFSKSKNDISRQEGLILICLYFIFIISETI